MSVRTTVRRVQSTNILGEIVLQKEVTEDLRASAKRWRDLYEAAARRCSDLEAKLSRGPVRVATQEPDP